MKLNFAENIKQLRKEKGITQETLAEQLGLSAQSISRWELSICYAYFGTFILAFYHIWRGRG